MCGIWNWLHKSSLYRAQKFSQTKYRSWPWYRDQKSKERGSPLIINNLSMRFQIYALIVLCSMSIRFKRFVRQSRPWSLTLWPKIDKVPPLIINNICVKSKTNHPISINKHHSVTFCELKANIFFLWEKKEELWLNPVTKTHTPTEQSKNQRDNIKTPPKTLITQLLRTDLGRSVGVTAVTQLVWLNRFTNAQPSH